MGIFEHKIGYNSACIGNMSQILVPNWGSRGWPVSECHLNWPPIDPSCHEIFACCHKSSASVKQQRAIIALCVAMLSSSTYSRPMQVYHHSVGEMVATSINVCVWLRHVDYMKSAGWTRCDDITRLNEILANSCRTALLPCWSVIVDVEIQPELKHVV